MESRNYQSSYSSCPENRNCFMNSMSLPIQIQGDIMTNFNQAAMNTSQNNTPVMMPKTKTGNTEYSQGISRTPLVLLNECCAKSKTSQPMFEIIEVPSPPHARIYDCNVKVCKEGYLWQGYGRGITKKDAKQVAARDLLMGMDRRSEHLINYKAEPVISTPEVDAEVTSNSVGDLMSTCAKLCLPNASYQELPEDKDLPQHLRVFKIECRLNKKTFAIGTGTSKKSAKKAAAFKVLQQVNEMMKNPAEKVPEMLDEDDIDDAVKRFSLMSIENTIFSPSPKSKFNQATMNTSQNNTGSQVLMPKTNAGNTDNSPVISRSPLVLLNECCAKSKTTQPMFEIIEVQSPPHARIYDCNVKVYKEGSLFQGHGRGITKKDSKQVAAKDLLMGMDGRSEHLINYKADPIISTPEVDSEVTSNSVGDLISTCSKLRLPNASYQELPEDKDLPQYLRVFKIECRINKKTFAIGSGTSKKSAKKAAAFKLLQQLNEMMENPAEKVPEMLAEDEIDDAVKRFTLMSIENTIFSPSHKSNFNQVTMNTSQSNTGTEVMMPKTNTGNTEYSPGISRSPPVAAGDLLMEHLINYKTEPIISTPEVAAEVTSNSVGDLMSTCSKLGLPKN